MRWLLTLAGYAKSAWGLAGGVMGSPMLIGGAIVAIVSAGSAGYVGYQYAAGQCAKDEVRRLELVAAIKEANREFADGVARRTETAIGKIRVEHKTLIQPEVRRELEIHRVLRDPDCAIPVSTVRVLNRARGYIDGRPPASKPGAALPEPRQAVGSQAAPDG